MKYSLPASFIALTLAACATSNVRVVSSDPTVAAKDFYTQLRHERIEGLPQGKQWRDLEPLMTPKLASEFREASRQQAVFLKKNPDEKAPWAEGDLFGSLFEGPQGFTVGSAVVKGEHAEVPVQLFYKEPLIPIELYFKPLTGLVWWGAGIMTAGAFLAAFQRRIAKKSAQPAPTESASKEEPETVATTA